MTLEEYLDFNDGVETRYELEDGILIEMPSENPINNAIALFLVIYLSSRLGIAPHLFATRHQIQVKSDKATAREPDLIIHSEASAAAIFKDGQLLRLNHPAPSLVVEVVSNSDSDKQSRDRDYVYKRQEYAQRGIPEYWIIEPMATVILVLKLAGERYEEQIFMKDESIVSPSFPDLKLTTQEILSAGR